MAKRLLVLLSIAVAIFALGGFYGYLKGGGGEDRTSTRALDAGWKTGALLLTTCVVIGILGGVIARITNRHFMISYALLIGIAMAILEGCGSMIYRHPDQFWSSLTEGFLRGAIIGAVIGWIHGRRMARSTTE
jgi:hypothetical protein